MKSKIKILYLCLSIIAILSTANSAQAQGLNAGICKGSDAEFAQYQQWLLSADGMRPQKGNLSDDAYQQKLQDWAARDIAKRQSLHICTPADIYKLIAKIINILIAIVGMFAIFRVIYGAFIMFGFPDNEDAIKEGKRILGNAMAGIVLVYASYLIVGAFFSILLQKEKTPPKFPFPFNLFQNK